MKKIIFLLLLVLFTVSSSVFSSAAVPTSRSLKSFKDNFATQDLLDQGDTYMTELFREGRMDFETKDYSGAGANNHHDPKSPGSTLP